MVMAAGVGSRLKPYADLAPKPLAPVLGIPSVEFSLRALARHGITRAIANVHHLADPLERELGRLCAELGISLTISDERQALLGSAGGLRRALPILQRMGGKRFLLLNADVLCDVDLGALMRHHARLRKQWGVTLTLTVFPRGPHGGKYREMRWDRQSSLLTTVGELEHARPYFVGAAVIEADALGGVPPEGACDFVPKILMPELARRKVGVFAAQGLWFDLGSPELWWRTHLELLARLETGALPADWRARFEELNERVGERAWARRGTSRAALAGLLGPGAYFDPDGDPQAVARVGHAAIQYGALSENGPLIDGLSRFGQAWRL